MLIKKTVIFLLFLLYINYNYANIDLKFRYIIEYDSNIFSLSDYDYNSFKKGRSFQYIDTTDDLKQKFEVRLNKRTNINDIVFSPYASFSFINFMNNTNKNSWNLLIGANNQWDQFTLNGVYGYYPENYLRKYIDTDGTLANEKFSYQKMLWRVSSSYRHNNYVIPLFYGKYEYYHYNEYFTEYDGPAWTFGLGWRLLMKTINTDMMYYYRTYNPTSNQESIQNIISNIKDGSYESNIYELKIRTKKFYSTLLDYRIFTNLKLEDRYYQSRIPLPIDPYHTNRNDKITTINFGSDLWLAKDFNIKIDYVYRVRNCSSDNPSVKRDKDYDKYQISTMLEYNFNIFKK